MEDGHRGGGNKPTKARGTFSSDGVGVRNGKASDFCQTSRDAGGLAFDAEKVAAGMLARHSNKKDPAVAAKIQLKRSRLV